MNFGEMKKSDKAVRSRTVTRMLDRVLLLIVVLSLTSSL